MRVAPSITLRPFRETDAAFFTGLATDERVTRYVGDGQPWAPQLVQDRLVVALQQEPVEQVGAIRWYIAEEAGEGVGLLVSTRRETGVEIGYWVSPAHWGRGVAGAMVDRAVAVVPQVYGRARLIARVDPANAASARLLTRRGFGLGANHDGLDRYVLVPAQ
ncbi:GNAT family N-acetyltransferase [Kocuria salina]|uniref:GNAT family N-acetyltransferase n=1 Tax=Kocuria salina TaxID=1929416 RepID=UPI0015938964|nr:GNAT family N-acetyltransferase [Kocuria salina]